MNTMNNNSNKKTSPPPGTTPGSSSGIDSRTDAINACKLMDTILSTPSFHQSLFTDSVQLFPTHILQEARLQSSRSDQYQKQSQDLTTTMEDLQSLVETTNLEINNALSKNPAWKTASPSLAMDTSALAAFDTASHQLIHAMQTFHESYQQNSSTSQQVLANQQQQQRGSRSSNEQDTIPGLGEAARALRSTQEALLNMMSNIRTVQNYMTLLADSSSQSNKAIASVQRDLIRGSGDPSVEAHLDRLYTMSATLERALQRK